MQKVTDQKKKNRFLIRNSPSSPMLTHIFCSPICIIFRRGGAFDINVKQITSEKALSAKRKRGFSRGKFKNNLN